MKPNDPQSSEINDKNSCWSTMVADLAFAVEDRKLFAIEDERMRVRALQGYFFPKLLVLLSSARSLIQAIYGQPSLDNFTEARRPLPKEGAARITAFDDAHVGLVGARVVDGLQVKSHAGKQIEYGVSQLVFEVLKRGSIAVRFIPIGYGDDRQFEIKVSQQLEAYSGQFFSICSACFVTSDAAMALDTLQASLSPKHLRRCRFFSAGIDFPVQAEDGLRRLVVTFAMLFPFQKLITDLSMGLAPSIKDDIDALHQWWGPDRLALFAPERVGILREQ